MKSRLQWWAVVGWMFAGCADAPLASVEDEDGTEAGTEAGTEVGPGEESGDETTGGVGEPVCCGCLCMDSSWSCSAETCVDERGLAVDIRAEAGFLELPALEDVRRDGWSYSVPAGRFWYSFQPARENPESAPLIIFSNGGPGGATTSGLFSMNVGERAVDTEADSPTVFDNPSSWTAFANLLFVDARATGFSYELGVSTQDHYNVDQDAADFIRLTSGFLERHPLLEADRIVFAGESYGGLRVAGVASLVWAQGELEWGAGPNAFQDPGLKRVLADYDRNRFGEFISIQGSLVSGPQQYEAFGAVGCVSGDAYACAWPDGDLDRRFSTAAATVVVPEHLSQLTGVDVTTIEWMYAENRQGEARRESWSKRAPAMESVFGPLPAGRLYFSRMTFIPHTAAEDFAFGHLGDRFLDALPNTRWFLTNAFHDYVVHVPSVLAAFDQGFPERIAGVERLSEDTVRFEFVDGSAREVLVAPYDAGHAVPSYTPEPFQRDVEAWLAAAE